MSSPSGMASPEFGWVDIYIGDGYSEMKQVAGAFAPRIPVPAEMQAEVDILREKCIEAYERLGDSEFSIMQGKTLLRVTQMQDVTNSHVFFLRRPEAQIREFATLGFPPHVVKMLLDKTTRGLILFAGEMGVGKTSSCASLAVKRLQIHGGVCIAIEDPPETALNGLHGNGRCIQITASRKSGGYREHLIKAMRSSADLILIGEIRDTAAAVEALKASLNGRLVIATVHAGDVPDVLTRMATFCAGELANTNDLLADGLATIIWQTIKRTPGQPDRLVVKTLTINKSDSGLRAKIRKGDFGQVNQDVDQQLKQASWNTDNLFGANRT
ncbi:Flp pilus assembly complex ATPase component TadA [Pseudomonas sp. WS 5532]|uniref:ATPase, T2SS/T4P/T4SS family n=1 Tax=Pseudomonas sp. WS 5532 TaxID=2717495 RepID=UPI001472DDAC|nr:ATPase, T2SS/T4P/T4SS family [Pseudomonas sp. WS 5532]NMX77860.1 Flp pilus assembly complex ATPase component TadA [Pseudomonas sp. WS 5532]